MDLKGKAAIVTGGGTGLGRAISLLLARAGARVAVNYSRSEQEARETAADCEAAGARAMAVRADVAAAGELQAMVGRVAAEFGRIDVLVNNAGTTVFVPMQDLDGVAEVEWDRIMDVNLKAHWLAARAAAPYLRAAGGGAIVNITSSAGLLGIGSSIPYCVSKAGAIMLTRCLATALAPEIRVNSVAPGLLRTRWGARWSDEQFAHFELAALLKRATPVEDVAGMVLAAIENDSLTGQTLVCDGGIALH